jgi:chemotaxis protein MotB
MTTHRPIILKKKVVHAGHHGGAWKVAYADFVTAMMALFIVLWLMNSSKQIREAVGGYFKDPSGASKEAGTGLKGSGDNFALSKDNMEQLKEELQKAVHKIANFDKLSKQIEMTVTPEGLRVELLEANVDTFFAKGDPEPNQSGRQLLVTLAQELGRLPNKISVEGHTDSKPFSGRSDYGNWELSSDRANATRRLMQQNGLGASQVTQVRGYADQRLRKPEAPEDPANRRVSLIVQYVDGKQAEPPAPTALARH